MRFLRSLSGVTLRDIIKSEKIRKKWNVEEMIDDIQNYKLKWSQHVLRMTGNRCPCKALQYRPQGKRDTVAGKTSSCSCRTGIVTQNYEGKKKKNR